MLEKCGAHSIYCSIFSFSIISLHNVIGYFCVQSNPSTTLIVPGSPQPSLWPWQCLLESACGVCFCISEERVSRGVKRKGKDSEAFKTSEGTTCKLKDHFRFSKILNFKWALQTHVIQPHILLYCWKNDKTKKAPYSNLAFVVLSLFCKAKLYSHKWVICHVPSSALEIEDGDGRILWKRQTTILAIVSIFSWPIGRLYTTIL